MPRQFLSLVKKVQRGSLEHLGESVRYLSQSGGSVTVQGIFDNTAIQVDPETEVTVSSNNPRCDVKLSDLPAEPREGDRLIARNTTYKVYDTLEDGLGMVSLLLHRYDD